VHVRAVHVAVLENMTSTLQEVVCVRACACVCGRGIYLVAQCPLESQTEDGG
jgi:hypothetical protein